MVLFLVAIFTVKTVNFKTDLMASLGSKREWEVSEWKEGKKVSMHNIPICVSPIKESQSTKHLNSFKGKLTDGKKCVQFLSLDLALKDAIKKAEEKQEAM